MGLQDNVTLKRFAPVGFRKERIPENLDAIVIGSGIGGMTAAATLAKLGKRVLVLEQHDQAGGCCHTFTEKGFEFDVGKKSCYYILDFDFQHFHCDKLQVYLTLTNINYLTFYLYL